MSIDQSELNSPYKKQVDECALDSCQKPIYLGQPVMQCGPDLYCDGKCLSKDLDAAVIEIN